MRMITFLAALAAGALLARAAARRTAAPAGSGAAAPGTRDWPTHARPTGDAAVRERLQARIARTLADPGAVQVEVRGGTVFLSGRVHARDLMLLIAGVENTAGVQAIRNGLEVQGSLDDAAPPMTQERPAVRAGELASSHMS